MQDILKEFYIGFFRNKSNFLYHYISIGKGNESSGQKTNIEIHADTFVCINEMMESLLLV